jgi:hypothetical protein
MLFTDLAHSNRATRETLAHENRRDKKREEKRKCCRRFFRPGIPVHNNKTGQVR